MIGAVATAIRRMLDRRADLCGINQRNVGLVYPHNARAEYPLADDKLRCKQRLTAGGVPVLETLAACEDLRSVHTAVDHLDEEAHFVVKPANGRRGEGIVVVGRQVGRGAWETVGGQRLSREALARHLANIVRGADAGRAERRQDERAVIDQLGDAAGLDRRDHRVGVPDGVRVVVAPANRNAHGSALSA